MKQKQKIACLYLFDFKLYTENQTLFQIVKIFIIVIINYDIHHTKK
jgi:hypothetical protein